MKILSIEGRLIYDSNSEITIKECVLEAISLGIVLSMANLSMADLSMANLSRANLSRANLSGANLSGANLSRADLSRANLSEANLSRADLSRANLSEADNTESSSMPMYCKWRLVIIGDKIKVGCKEMTPKEWIVWLKSNEEFETKRGTEEFKQIEACIRAYVAYQEVLKSK